MQSCGEKLLRNRSPEGRKGFFRDVISIKIFNEFLLHLCKGRQTDQHADVVPSILTRFEKDLGESIPEGFLDSLLHMYDYTVLQEVKGSLYYFNEEEISRTDPKTISLPLILKTGDRLRPANSTGERIKITEDFFRGAWERYLLDEKGRDREKASGLQEGYAKDLRLQGP